MKWVTILLGIANAFYLPGVAPKDYPEGAEIELFVNKLDSSETQLPFDYYYLNFCPPQQLEKKSENLGQILSGDRMENSPYQILMNIREPCRLLCDRRNSNDQIENFKWMIEHEYRASWVVDNLPSGLRKTIVHGQAAGKFSYYQDGFPIGYIKGKTYYINNHAHIVLKIHKTLSKEDGSEVDAWRVVGFLVEPFSIANESLITRSDPNGEPQCDPNFKQLIDQSESINEQVMRPEDLVDRPSEYEIQGLEPQVLDSRVMYTYSVAFEESDIKWASRWDIYLYMEGDSNEVHWLSIINSFAMVIFLSGMVAHILSRTLKRDINYYNERAELDAGDDTGWKQVHGDVFRRPIYSSLFAVVIGSGVQVIAMGALTLVFACLGFLSPAHRGGLLTTMLLLYVFMGIFAGYISSRLYKMFGNVNWKRNTLGTAILLPGISFSIFFVVNTCIWIEESSGAVPFTSLLALLVLWFGISVPLVFLGSAIGYRKDPIENPCDVHRIPRMIKLLPGEKRLKAICLMAGSLPFGCMFIELSYVMKSMWHHALFYYLFGFLFLCFIVLMITSAEVSILMTYILLCREDYRWWWLSFGVAGSSGIYLFIYSFIYFVTELRLTRFSSIVLYFGYMGLSSLAYALITGTIGFIATFIFIRTIYSLIKVE